VRYLDNAATTWPKPEIVYREMDEFARTAAANPGRSGHRMAVAAEHKVQECRERVARLLNAESPSRVALTLNATDGLNMALKGLLNPGDHVVTSEIEHNSINRPLSAMQKAGLISFTKVRPQQDGTIAPADVAAAMTKKTKLIAITHCSNVLGVVCPAEEYAKIAHKQGALLVLDASQTAGVAPIDVRAMGVDVVAFPGHKACFGPMGTGALYVREGVDIRPMREGGTGYQVESEFQPTEMPFRLEGGTPNAHGYAGLAAGLKFIEDTGIEKIRMHERVLAMTFIEAIKRSKRITIWSGRAPDRQLGPVSITIRDAVPAEVGTMLDQRYDIACRPGMHCAPGTHKFLGTFPQGTVRFSFGFFNTDDDVEAAAKAVHEIVSGMTA